MTRGLHRSRQLAAGRRRPARHLLPLAVALALHSAALAAVALRDRQPRPADLVLSVELVAAQPGSAGAKAPLSGTAPPESPAAEPAVEPGPEAVEPAPSESASTRERVAPPADQALAPTAPAAPLARTGPASAPEGPAAVPKQRASSEPEPEAAEAPEPVHRLERQPGPIPPEPVVADALPPQPPAVPVRKPIPPPQVPDVPARALAVETATAPASATDPHLPRAAAALTTPFSPSPMEGDNVPGAERDSSPVGQSRDGENAEDEAAHEPPGAAPAHVARAVPRAAPQQGAASERPATSSTSAARSTPPSYAGLGGTNPEPRYPYAARRRGEEGRVVLRVQVAPDGRARSVEVRASSGSHRLDEAAVATVERWRFRPATADGALVTRIVDVPITFRLEDGPDGGQRR